jgi:hypothetical protein
MTVTAFLKHELVAQGAADAVAAKLGTLPAPDRASDLLVFEDETGRQIDLPRNHLPEGQRGRGRPPLGVKPREVTLLPRHWDWLAAQRGGASAALRRLVDEAMAKAPSPTQARDAAYRFLSAIAGDFPRFEDAIRELYQGNSVGYDHFTQGWPPAVRDHGRKLAFGA